MSTTIEREQVTEIWKHDSYSGHIINASLQLLGVCCPGQPAIVVHREVDVDLHNRTDNIHEQERPHLKTIHPIHTPSRLEKHTCYSISVRKSAPKQFRTVDGLTRSKVLREESEAKPQRTSGPRWVERAAQSF